MQTDLAAEFKGTREGTEAEAILRKCVHCGFCTATCPTYQLLGDELDSPRGRIYLIKQMLEGGPVTRTTQLHLDRCLTCRNCETTCPSGVQYGRLVDIGRAIVEERVPRSAPERAVRFALKEGLTSGGFAPAMKLGQFFRPFLPPTLKDKVPVRASPRAALWPTRTHKRKVLMLLGCVQPSMAPNINSASARVLDAAGIQTLVADGSGCCGALRTHLADVNGGLADMRRNIDAWWPLVDGLTSEGKVEAIVMNASGCGVTVKEYGHALAHDPQYAERARRIGKLTRDLSEFLPEITQALAGRVHGTKGKVLAWHPPCSLQHGQQLRGGVETALRALGFDVRLAAQESHLCCGSAGTYSVLQPVLAKALRNRKLAHLAADDLHRSDAPDVVVSANIGCIQHLQSGSPLRVAHWVEVLDEALA